MVKDYKLDPNGKIALKALEFPIGATSVSQTAALVNASIPGWKFIVMAVELFCTALAGTASVDVQIGSTSVLASQMTPVAGSVVAGVLSATRANVVGEQTSQLNVKYTTNGTGVITNGYVRVWVRPQPLNGEVAQ